MDKILSGLKIEYWYHVFIILGAVGIISSLIFEFKGITNANAILLFFGIFFFGIGEWINHPLQTSLMRPNVYAPGGGIMHGHPRKNKFMGIFFDVIGFIFLLFGVYKIANI